MKTSRRVLRLDRGGIRATGLLLAVTLSASLGIAAPLAFATQAEAATGSLVTATGNKALGNDVAARTYPTASAAVVVRSDSDAIITQAAALAAVRGVPMIVADTGDTAAAVSSLVKARGASSVVLFGTSTAFAASFKTDLATTLTITATVESNDYFARSVSAAALSPATPTQFVVATTSAPSELRLASQYAISTGVPLVLFSGSEDPTAVTAFFNQYPKAALTIMGFTDFPATLLSEDRSDSLEVVSMENASATALYVARRPLSVGYSQKKIYEAPSDQLAAGALASLMARTNKGVVLSAGATSSPNTASEALTFAGLVGAEATSVTLVGKGLTTAQATAAAAPTLTARAAPDGWRVTNLVPATSSFALSYNAAANATSYRAYDLEGTQVGSSSTTSMTIAGLPYGVTLVSYSSAGAEIARLEVRENEYEVSANRETALVAQARKTGRNYLKILGAVKVPRAITRITVDPFVEFSEPSYKEIAVTCNFEFTDVGLDTTKQYTYEIATLSSGATQACDSTAPALTSSTETSVSSVTLPPTTFPEFAVASAAKAMATTSSTPVVKKNAAMPTLSDSFVLRAQGKDTVQSVAVAGEKLQPMTEARAASSLPDVYVRYQGFIPQDKVKVLTPPAQGLYQYTYFGGDNRSQYVGCSYCSFRFQATTRFPFASGGTVKTTPAIGESHEYRCTQGAQSCVLNRTASASLSTVYQAGSSIAGNRATARVVVHSPLPLIKAAPAIDGDMTFNIGAGRSTVTGTHDRMPVHEIFIGVANSEYSTSYVSRDPFLGCLFPLGPVGNCQVRVNQSL